MGLGSPPPSAQGQESPNNLLSTSYAKILLLLCKGRVKGWVGEKLSRSLQINSIPLESPDGSLNYKGWKTHFREGVANQEIVPGNEQNAVIQSVNAIVRSDLDVTRTVNEPSTNAIDVVIKIPALLRKTAEGAIAGSSVSYVIEYQPVDQSYQTAVQQTIIAKTNSPYQRSHRIELEGEAPWNIRVHKATPDSRDESLKNTIEWDYLTRIEYERRGYSGYCVAGLHIDVKELTSLDAVDVILDAQLVLAPHNYNGEQHSYSGFFDGSLILQWSNNPVWVLLDVLLERLPLSAIRLYEFYEAAQYCDEEINGSPRFTFNHVFTDRESNFSTARKVAGAFNGRLVPTGTKLGLVVDKPETPLINFDISEMSERPSYRITSSLEIATICTVTYQEPAQNYDSVSFVVRDEPGVARFGEQNINLKAVGCTNREEAARLALWTLCTPRLNPVRLHFEIPLSGKMIKPGRTFTVTDPRRDRKKASGRIVSFTPDAQGDRIILDAPYKFEIGGIYIFCLIDDAGMFLSYEINPELSTVDGFESSLVRVSLSTPILEGDRPLPGDLWAIKPRDQKLGIAYRATDVKPVAGKHNHFGIEAILYDEDKFSYIDSLGAQNAGQYQVTPPSGLLNLPGIPFNVVAVENFKDNGQGGFTSSATLSWSYAIADSPQLSYFEIEYRTKDEVVWEKVGTSTGRSLVFSNLDPDEYEFRVAAVSLLGQRSEWGSTSLEGAIANSTEPGSVNGLSLSRTGGNMVSLKWDASTDPPVRFGGYFRIRHTPRVFGAAWESGTLVAKIPGTADQIALPYQQGTYMLRAYSSNNVASALPSKISTTLLPGLAADNVLFTFNESPTFEGNKDGVIVVSEKLRLADDVAGSFSRSGYYSFGQTFSTGNNTPQRVYLYPIVDVSVIRQDELWDNLANPFDSNPVEVFYSETGNPEADYGESPFAKVEVSISVNGSIFSQWTELVPGDYQATDIKARLHMATDRPGLSNEVRTLELLVHQF